MPTVIGSSTAILLLACSDAPLTINGESVHAAQASVIGNDAICGH